MIITTTPATLLIATLASEPTRGTPADVMDRTTMKMPAALRLKDRCDCRLSGKVDVSVL